MKKLFYSCLAAIIVSAIGVSQAQAQCAKIKDGTIVDSAGNTVSLGNDQYGYNYQAHMFNGLYDNFTRPATPATEGPVNLIMKWSDDWLANADCNGDNKLDRGLDAKTGVSTGVSRGWLTNHEEGDYLDVNGDPQHYTYFVKIVYDGGAACASASDSCIWGLYSVIEENYQDPSQPGKKGDRNHLVNPGLGNK